MIVQAPTEWEGATTVNSEKNAAKPVRECVLIDLSTVQPRAVDWIEKPYLAKGEFHVIQGQGGSYKGTMCFTWASEFSKRAEHVLLILAEDDLATKVKPALMAMGADTKFVHPLVLRCGENEDAIILPNDLPILEREILKVNATFVVIDPLLSHVSGNLDSYRDHDMKRCLTQVSKVAQRTGAAILSVHHLKKDTSGGLKLAGQASTAIYTTARVLLTMAKISEEQAVIEVTKSNLGPEGVRQLLNAEIVTVGTDEKTGLPIETPILTRAGESPVSAQEAIEGQQKDSQTKTLKAAIRMLDILEEEGEQKQAVLFERVAKEAGLTTLTVRRKVYWGPLMKEDLVQARKESQFTGNWLVSRSEVERPKKLQSAGHTSEETEC
jgi:hypothetical protein